MRITTVDACILSTHCFSVMVLGFFKCHGHPFPPFPILPILARPVAVWFHGAALSVPVYFRVKPVNCLPSSSRPRSDGRSSRFLSNRFIFPSSRIIPFVLSSSSSMYVIIVGWEVPICLFSYCRVFWICSYHGRFSSIFGYTAGWCFHRGEAERGGNRGTGVGTKGRGYMRG